jgi:menaquinone-dependent protoporphyrinogen IX oxidase
MKTLVVYFSRNGQTPRLAREIARRCNGDMDVIEEQYDPASLSGRCRTIWDALRKADAPIRKPARNPGRYDLVIIGSPAASMGVPPPVRTYLHQYAGRIRQVAFFCAEGGADDQRNFAELSRLCGKLPLATFAVERKNLPAIAHMEGVSGFMDNMHLHQREQTAA